MCCSKSYKYPCSFYNSDAGCTYLDIRFMEIYIETNNTFRYIYFFKHRKNYKKTTKKQQHT